MGRKQRDMTCLKPFCFYCEKAFKNEVILHHHQKAKHFSCPKCPKKFSSIDSMTQHARSSHNVTVDKVPNANANRDSIYLKIFGMQGVPRVEIDSWISRNINRTWGRIVDKQIAEQKKAANEKSKEREERPEEMEVEQVVQDQEYPLEFTFPEI